LVAQQTSTPITVTVVVSLKDYPAITPQKPTFKMTVACETQTLTIAKALPSSIEYKIAIDQMPMVHQFGFSQSPQCNNLVTYGLIDSKLNASTAHSFVQINASTNLSPQLEISTKNLADHTSLSLAVKAVVDSIATTQIPFSLIVDSCYATDIIDQPFPGDILKLASTSLSIVSQPFSEYKYAVNLLYSVDCGPFVYKAQFEEKTVPWINIDRDVNVVGKHQILMDASFTFGGELKGVVTLTASFANYPTNKRTNAFSLTIESINIECSEPPESDEAQQVYVIGDPKLSFPIKWVERSNVKHVFELKAYARDKAANRELPDSVIYDTDSDRFSVESSSDSMRGNYTIGLNFTQAAFPVFHYKCETTLEIKVP
jgi:hypothetical protein